MHARNPLWNSSKLDKRGDMPGRNPLYLANTSKKDLACVPRNYSMIGLTLAGKEIRIQNWKFLNFESLPDPPFIHSTLHIDKHLLKGKKPQRSQRAQN